MKITYYKIVSRYSNRYELKQVRYQNGVYEVAYEWYVEGTKFSVIRLDEAKKLAQEYDADVYEVHEEWIRI